MTSKSPSSKESAKRVLANKKLSHVKLRADAIRESLIDLILSPGSELKFLDKTLEVPYLMTSGKEDLSFDRFKRLDSKMVTRAVRKGEKFTLDGYDYSIESSLRKTFVQLLKDKDGDSVEVFSLTIQTKNSIERFFGKSAKKLAKLVAESLPKAIEANGGIRERNKRDTGRKIGFAAKDFAALQATRLTIKKLKKLEELGGDDARKAVCKGNVVAKPVLEELKLDGVAPAMAYLAVKFWRVLSVRPADDYENRMHYLSLVPSIFDCVVSKNTVVDAYKGTLQLINKSLCNPKKVMGAGLNAAINSCSTKTFELAFEIERCVCLEDAWEVVTKSLATTAASEAKAPLPKRVAAHLDQLIRKPTKNRSRKNELSIEAFGLTGFEMGNWVSSTEGKILQRLALDAFSDLVSILGSRFVSLAQEGNLALSLGARGSGRACATYSPELKVINLTKTKGDGSLAHEVGHFLDNMLAHEHLRSESLSPYLSDSAIEESKLPVVKAMANVMNTIQIDGFKKEIVFSEASRRRYKEKWVLESWNKSGQSPQKAFDLLVSQSESQFTTNFTAREKSTCLVNSIAKWTGQPVEIEIRFLERTEYFKNATKLPAYWGRPHELFARAFESFVEDSLHKKGCVNEFLVKGTCENYDDKRGVPYPQGDERERINKAISKLLKKVLK